MTVSQKQKILFDNTYASLLGRIRPDGYAPTSVTGAYEGMFSRDASIQIMAHVACRDYDAARRMLDYIFTYHQTYGYDFALHIMLENKPPYSDMVQADATFFLLHAWCVYVRHAPQSAEKDALISKTRGLVIAFANHYLTPEFFWQEGKLLRNQNLEGPRMNSYFNGYDLLTNIYASQVLHELVALFAASNALEAEMWSQYAELLREGVHAHLTAEVDGKRVYMEMLALSRDDGRTYHNIPHRRSYIGFSWVNLSVLGLGWYGADAQIVKNTYEAYKKYAYVPYFDAYPMPEHSSMLHDDGTCTFRVDHVLGKALAWELIYCHDIGDTAREAQILEFIERFSDQMYRETWKYAGGGSDTANQEHASWMICAVQYAAGLADEKN